jgi:hypothetical protein
MEQDMLKKILIGTLIGLGAAASASAAVNCASFPNATINQFVNDDVVAVGVTCTIGPQASINGGVTQTGDGGLIIRGIVNGAVSEAGPGDVVIARGARVAGDVSEADGGNVSLRGGATIDGAIEESGDGSVNVTVDVPGLVKGNINENGAGGVTVNAAFGSFEGSVTETGPGNVVVQVGFGQSFKGDVEEHDGGSVTADVNGFFEGNIVELGLGNVATSGPGVFKGNSEHQLPGACTNSIVNFQGAACNLL